MKSKYEKGTEKIRRDPPVFQSGVEVGSKKPKNYLCMFELKKKKIQYNAFMFIFINLWRFNVSIALIVWLQTIDHEEN